MAEKDNEQCAKKQKKLQIHPRQLGWKNVNRIKKRMKSIIHSFIGLKKIFIEHLVLSTTPDISDQNRQDLSAPWHLHFSEGTCKEQINKSTCKVMLRSDRGQKGRVRVRWCAGEAANFDSVIYLK